jgi:hypothetical protein
MECVTVEEWALIASVVFVGLFSGLYGMLTLILHQVMGAMNGPEFARFLRRFLTVARKSPFNYVVVIGMVLAPAVALIATDDAGSTPFVSHRDRARPHLGRERRGLQPARRAQLRPNARLGYRSVAGGLGGEAALLLQAQLDPGRLHLDSVRSLSCRARGTALTLMELL